MTRGISRFRWWLLPFAGEHGYRDVTGERWRVGPWLAYRAWCLLRRWPMDVEQPQRPASGRAHPT